MIVTRYIVCPVHGRHDVSVEKGTHTLFFSRETAPCPVCKKRLDVQEEIKDDDK